jgi:hypothetical protein
MKYCMLFLIMTACCSLVQAQKYPEPEFSKEVYWLKKDSIYSVSRLEKGSSKLESKAKLGGMGGSESSYIIEGEKSTIRISNYKNLSFIFSTGAASSKSSSQADSMMRANGIDPSDMMGGMNDPSSNIVLYKLETANGKRKILMQKNPGMSPFGSKKQKTGEKFTFSVKKIREGYWELLVDKTLPRGEYAFASMGSMGSGNMDGSITIFSFGVE